MKKLTILYDNTATSSSLLASHGFSCLLEGEENILFDTGESGSLLLKNMETLGINPLSVSAVVISHEHYDHIGGLASFLSVNPRTRVYMLPPSSGKTEEILSNAWENCIVSGDPRKLTPSIMTTGKVEGPCNEQGLVVQGEEGALLLVGCCHPGPVAMVERASLLAGRKILYLVGGFHFLYTPEEETLRILRALKDLGVVHITPAHCTGFFAIEAIHNLWGERCTPGGVGKTIFW